MKIRRLHAAAIAGVMLTGVLATQAGAASKPKAKPSCNLLVDEKGDAAFISADANSDIISADIASNAANLTAVLRLASWADQDLPNAPIGRSFYVTFSVPGAANPVYLELSKDALGEVYSYGQVEPSPNGSTRRGKGAAVGTIDKAKGIISISISLDVFSAVAKIKPGMKLTGLEGLVTSLVGAPGVGGFIETIDDATDGKAYTAGSPSCVKVG